MVRNSRSAKARRLAAELAKRTDETKTEAVTKTLPDRPEPRVANKLEEIAEHCTRLPVLDPRSAEEILGYDDTGLPR